MPIKAEAGLNITANDLASPTMKKIAETTKSLGRQFKVVGKDISSMGEGFKNFFPQFTFQMGIKGLKSLTDNLKNLMVNTADYGDKIAGIAEKTGFGTKALQEYSYAAKFSNMTSEEFTNSIENMNKSMGQLRAGGGALVSGLKIYPQFF